MNKPISLRFSAGTTVLNELNDECILDIEDAIRLNASALAIMVSIGGHYEAKTIENLVRTADMGARYGIPTLGVTAVGKELTRDARYLGMASRVLAAKRRHLRKDLLLRGRVRKGHGRVSRPDRDRRRQEG